MFKLNPKNQNWSKFFLYFSFCFLFLFSAYPLFAQEQITVTTYYPAPYAVYQELRLFPNDIMNPGDACTNEGELRFHDTNSELMACRDGAVGLEWLGSVGLWGVSGNNIYNANTGNVVIGAAGPSILLDVVGTQWVGINLGRTDSTTSGILSFDTSVLSGDVNLRNEGGTFTTYVGGTQGSVIGTLGLGITSNSNVVIKGLTPYGDSSFSILGSNTDNDAVFTAAMEDGTVNPAFSILPFTNQVYLSSGAYYSNAAWVHHSDNTNSQVLELNPGGGARWYASSNSSVSWNVSPGVQLWNDAALLIGSSSRELKDNFTHFDFDNILEKINRLEVTRWNYKSEGDKITHIGPVAEDFYRIFKTGDSDKNIALIDSSGVALAGVKGLIKKMGVQQQQIEELKQEIEELKLQQ